MSTLTDGRREVMRNTFFSMMNEGAILVSATVSVFLLIPELGAADYGSYASMFALIGPFAAFAHSGVTLTLVEHVVASREPVADVVKSCLSISLLIALMVAPICIGLAVAFVDALSTTTVVLFVMYELVLQAAMLTTISAVQAAHSYATGIALRVTLQFLRIGVLIGLVVTGTLSLAHLAIANAVAFAAFTLVLVVLAPRWGVSVVRFGRIRRDHLKSSFLYAFGVSSSITQGDGDKFVLEASNHRGDTGVYAAGYRLVSLGMLPLSAFTGSTHWAVLRSVEDESNQFRRATRFAMVSVIYAVPAIILLILTAPFVSGLLGDEFEGSATVIRYLAPVVLIRGVSIFPLNGLLGLGRNPLRSAILGGNAAFSVVLYLVLIPPYSWKGAVVATLVSETTLFVASWTALARAQRRATAQIASAVGSAQSPDVVAQAEREAERDDVMAEAIMADETELGREGLL